MVTRIKGDTSISEDSLFKKGWFSINGKKIEVPLHVTDINKLSQYFGRILPESIHFNEIFRQYSIEKINRMNKDGQLHRREENILKKYVNISNTHKPIIIFYRIMGSDYPEEDQIKTLVDLHYTHSDVMALPSMPDVFSRTIKKTIQRGVNKGKIKYVKNKQPASDKHFFDYLKELEKFIDIMHRRNNKEILGVLPLFLAPSRIRELINFYVNKEIFHYYLDFNTRLFQGADTHLSNLQAELSEHDLELEKTFIYSINSGSGKFSKNDTVIGAKDILTSGIGVDCVGKLHIGGGSKEENTDPNVKLQILKNRVRIFNRSDYGYYKSIDASKFSSVSSNIELRDFIDPISEKDLILSKLFNMEQLSKESVSMQHYLKDKKKPLSWIKKNKDKVESRDLKKINLIRKTYTHHSRR